MSNEITFRVQGSASEPYTVNFSKDGDNLSAHCDCKAGLMRQHCKHRLNILAGDASSLVSGNEADIATVREWLEGSDVQKYIEAVHMAERDLWTAQAKFRAAKKALARALND